MLWLTIIQPQLQSSCYPPPSIPDDASADAKAGVPGVGNLIGAWRFGQEQNVPTSRKISSRTWNIFSYLFQKPI